MIVNYGYSTKCTTGGDNDKNYFYKTEKEKCREWAHNNRETNLAERGGTGSIN